MKVMRGYFYGLEEQITNIEKWSQDKFVVFNHEAGTGKSTETHRIIGEMTKSQAHRVLYVQKFLKDDELNNTVEVINRHAGRKVAVSYSGEDTRKVKAKELLIDRQVICITHQMYIQICKGEHQYLVEERDILIIDEYPDLLEKLSISSNEIGQLWTECNKWDVPDIEEWALTLRNLMDEITACHQEMKFIDFAENRYRLVQMIKSAIGRLNDKRSNGYKGILQKSLQLIKNGGFLFEDSFHTFDGNQQFVLLKNNIILDANAGFDSRYELCERFNIRKQDKAFEYARDTLHHIQVKTTKKGIQKFNELIQEAMKRIQIDGKSGILFVTDKANVEKLRQEIIGFFSPYGTNIEEIEERMKCKLSIDYFGNIIGVNHYREYDCVVLLKTPHYDYLTYALTYHYYKSMNQQPIDDVQLFKHQEVEEIRRSTVAGEMYQAIKRVNRDNSRLTVVYVFTDYQEAVDMVVKQLPNIRYIKTDFNGTKQKDGRDYDNTRRIDRSKKRKAELILLEAKGSGKPSIRKKELRDQLEITNGSGLSHLMKRLEPFLKEHGISLIGQRIVFQNNLKDLENNDLNESA
ncbi:hypothetical protein ABFY57_12065 [Paenibacillus polymyxa]|uniref:hypothetical protein n=1 Tax=Paenibacillus polymyxa TaxID=1406 RepID=UPI00201906B0|nr:hypothetical protein [Paenibacillus polymyxa]UQQ36183.1 hypothetical protein LMH85_04490 [Paenibacillus polymyxa]